MAHKTILSYASTPASVPYMYQTIVDRMRQLASERPDKEAFIFYNNDKRRISITRKQLLDQTEGAARRLVKLGVRKGTTIAFCMSNSMEMLVMNLAVIMAGGIPIFLSANLKDGSDIVGFINDLDGHILIMDANMGDANWNILNNIWPQSENVSQKAPCLKMIICNGENIPEVGHYKKLSTFLTEEDHNDTDLPRLLPEDTLAYFCSSGSTGKPKVIVLSHFAILNWSKMTNIGIGINENSVFFCDRTFGWTVGFPRTYLTEGTTRVFVDTRISAAGKHTDFLCDIIFNEKCDVVYLPGYIVADILSNPDLSSKFQHVQTMFLSGERVVSSNYTALKEKFCTNVLVWYGSTEVGGVTLYDGKGTFQDGFIGKPLQGVELKVINESGEVVPAETRGELCVRCNWRFSGYRNMDEAFHGALDDNGWFRTGDIAYMQLDGNFVADGRYKEVISTGTSKFFPWAIEKILKNIKGVEHAIAVGVPDPRLHQVVCACVVPYPGISISEADVKAFCDESFLEESTTSGVSLKPRYFLVLDQVPLTSSGKLDRRNLGIIAKNVLGL